MPKKKKECCGRSCKCKHKIGHDRMALGGSLTPDVMIKHPESNKMDKYHKPIKQTLIIPHTISGYHPDIDNNKVVHTTTHHKIRYT